MRLDDAAIVLALPLLADAADGHHGWDDGWWVVMAIGMVILWAAIIAGGIWLVRELSGRGRARATGETPLEILDRRLAEGEISSEEYEARRRTLRNAREGPDRDG